VITAGVPIAAREPDAGSMRVRARELMQIFNPIDPSPLAERDLNEETERFIVSWARDLPAAASLSLTIEMTRPLPLADAERPVEGAVHMFFQRRGETAERELRAMLRRGRTSLVIGLVFLTICVLSGDFVATRLPDSHLAGVLREGLTVAGWVSMWRPMEIFLYNWWPLAGDRRLYARLARMPIHIVTSTEPAHSPEPAAPGGRGQPILANTVSSGQS
jgi:hypothetical protein